jgi:hypothetical protein
VKITADDVAKLLWDRPPREVPPHMARAAKAGNGSWAVIIFGLVFGGFGLVFVIGFFPWRFMDAIQLRLHGRPAVGVVRSLEKTNMAEDETPVMEYFFDFTTADNVRTTTSCYATGTRWAPGDQVEVTYLPAHPAVACFRGARVNRAGWVSGVIMIIFPIIGFGVAGWGWSGRRQAGWLLREGRAVEVDILGVDATTMRMNYQTVYKITVSAPGLTGGAPVVIRRWGTAEVSLLTARALKKEPIYVLFDPRRPKQLIFPEALIDPPSP